MPRDLILEVKGLSKQYRQAGCWPLPKSGCVALHQVSFSLECGTTLAITGHSGAGKSTLARCIAGLEQPDAGEIWFGGKDLARSRTRRSRVQTGRIHMIFQDPGASLNPRFTAFDIVEEPMRFLPSDGRRESAQAVGELMDVVGLLPLWANRKSWQFSSGQRARLALARALAWAPSLLILDESLSNLDLSVRSQIVNLLIDLQQSRGLTYVLISHDMRIAEQFADRVLVLEGGRMLKEESQADRTAFESVEI